eukprot:Phypoly_transcript_17407.p1 GENE.Phypoly_transcript_17407~~Phypoly_transcript_17407.p1  ORF type:complete len:224 (+),score=35.31 Phypoly_transcript_17407:131-802(+)
MNHFERLLCAVHPAIEIRCKQAVESKDTTGIRVIGTKKGKDKPFAYEERTITEILMVELNDYAGVQILQVSSQLEVFVGSDFVLIYTRKGKVFVYLIQCKRAKTLTKTISNKGMQQMVLQEDMRNYLQASEPFPIPKERIFSVMLLFYGKSHFYFYYLNTSNILNDDPPITSNFIRVPEDPNADPELQLEEREDTEGIVIKKHRKVRVVLRKAIEKMLDANQE